MDRRLVGFLLIAVASAGFGSGPLFAKGVYSLGTTGFLTLLAWRFLFGAAASWAWISVSASRRAAARRMARRMVVISLGLGVLYIGNSASYYAALTRVSASLAALIVFTYPAIVAVLSLRFGRRLRGRRAWTALAMTIVGSVLTIGGIPADELPDPGWLVLVAISPIVYSCWIILQAWATGERANRAAGQGDDADPTVAGALMNTGAAGAYWLIAIGSGSALLPSPSTPQVWVLVAGFGLLSTFVAIVGFVEGSRRTGAANAALISTIEPLWTIVFGALLLGEGLTPVQVAGGAMIMAGVLVAQSARPATEQELVPTLVRVADE